MTSNTLPTVGDKQTCQDLPALLQQLTDSQAVAIAISLLFDTFEPEEIDLDFSANPSTPAWSQCIQWASQLSHDRKLMLSRCIVQQIACGDTSPLILGAGGQP